MRVDRFAASEIPPEPKVTGLGNLVPSDSPRKRGERILVKAIGWGRRRRWRVRLDLMLMPAARKKKVASG